MHRRRRHTNSSRFNHVANSESLYCLVFGCASGAIGTSDRLNMAATLLVTSTVIEVSASIGQHEIHWSGKVILGRAFLDHDC